MNGLGQIQVTTQADIESEVFVVGAMMGGKQHIDIVTACLDVTDLYRPINQEWFQTIVTMQRLGTPVDYIALTAMAQGQPEKLGGVAYLTYLYEFSGLAQNIEWHAAKVKRASLLRQYRQICLNGYQTDFANVGNVDEFLNDAHRQIYTLAAQCVSKGLQPIRPVVEKLQATFAERFENPIEIVGLSTGFPAVDAYLQGLKPGSLYVVAGRPSMGKTALALKIAYNVAMTEKHVAMFSYEMLEDDLVTRLICSEGEVDKGALDTGQIRKHDYARAQQAMEHIISLPIFVDDDPNTNMLKMGAKCRQMAIDHGLDLIVVDYIGLIKPRMKHNSAREDIEEISRDLKLLAMELQVPVIALSQLSRAVESRDNKRPMLSDLRESGAIEQDADAVIFPYRDAYYKRKNDMPAVDEFGVLIPEVAEIIVEKHRNGPTGTGKVGFIKQYAKFLDLDAYLKSPDPTGF
jgi:replicative DNA helicase